MNLSNLKPAKGSVKKKKRIARGEGSGKGGTSTRGHKGAKSRSGYSAKIGFEGGQMPLQRRIPKRGFKNPNRTEYAIFNLDRIQEISEKYSIAEFSPEKLIELGMIRKADKVKVLGRGELKAKVNCTAHHFSAAAKEGIEKAGGTANIIEA